MIVVVVELLLLVPISPIPTFPLLVFDYDLFVGVVYTTTICYYLLLLIYYFTPILHYIDLIDLFVVILLFPLYLLLGDVGDYLLLLLYLPIC